MDFKKQNIQNYFLYDTKVDNLFISEYMPGAPANAVKVYLLASMKGIYLTVNIQRALKKTQAGFTILYGEGVERIFNLNSPVISKITVDRVSKVLRAKLYYMRNRVGKSAMQVKEKRFETKALTEQK